MVTIKTAQSILRNYHLTKFVLLFVLCFTFNHSKAQQPAYFIFGEDQFRGVQIYDVIQDKELNYWFGTNEGLYCFDSYNYEKIECSKAKSSSVFNFVINSYGEIYCHNLNNQIFQIIGKECKLFYELKNDEINSDLSLTITNEDHLLIGGKKIIVLNRFGKKISQYNAGIHFFGQPFKDSKKSIHFSLNNSDSIISYSNGIFKKNKLLVSSKLSYNSVLKFYTIGSTNYALNLRNKDKYIYNQNTYQLTLLPKDTVYERSEHIRIYEIDGEVWVAGTLPGVVVINNKKSMIFYDNYYISDVYKDYEGNILLSTFDKGILVIPNTQIQDVIDPFKDDPATSLFVDSIQGLFIGTSKGSLLNYKNTIFSPINKEGKRPIEAIYGTKYNDLLIFDDGHIRAFNKKTKKIINIIEASLKDVSINMNKDYFLGTNRGVIKANWDGGNKFSVKVIKGLTNRIYALEYNLVDSCLYASTSIGLTILFPNDSIKQIVYNKEAIFPNYLSYDNGKVYAFTKKNGVFVLKNGEIIRTFIPLINSNPEPLKKAVIYQNTIIAKSANGLLQFDMNGKFLKSIDAVFGILSKRVIDFTIIKNQLWVSHTGGVQMLDLTKLNSIKTKPIIRINKILLNNESIDIHKFGNFKSDQRKIQFVFSSPTIKNRETIRYYYKLVGNETEWNSNKYGSNEISYNALASGNYTLIVKAGNQGLYSDPISFSFSIAHPYYEQWWFITLIVLIFLLIVYFIYRWQLNIQQKKSQQINELNASKLTAIQSQMNPHFIFNSLNSIQDLILKGDVEHSYSYITKFSNLVRRTLSYSEKDFIDFDQEIKLLELYLSLEKLRFKKDFNYTININHVDDVMLPPLLIQPFIENSLLHGLLHKEGRKILKITFELKDTLICTVEDNGVGREKAKAIKLRQRSEHESFSGKAIQKRFEILSNVFEGNFGYRYEDLHENNEAMGTKVILSIPIKHKF